MPYSFQFDPQLIEINHEKCTSKADVLKVIAQVAKKSAQLKKYSEQDLFKGLMEREKAGSTGFGKGIAIPHCRLANLDTFVMGAVVFREGVPFDSLDGAPVQLVFFIFGPEQARSRHIQILSELSKILLNKGAYQELVFSASSKDFVRNLESHMTDTAHEKEQEYRMVQIAVQREEYFEGILQELSGIVKGNLIILESDKASSYFHALPLFSSYWSETGKCFSRLIIAVSEKEMVNEIARRISLITGDLNSQKGVMITIQPISVVLGSIDF